MISTQIEMSEQSATLMLLIIFEKINDKITLFYIFLKNSKFCHGQLGSQYVSISGFQEYKCYTSEELVKGGFALGVESLELKEI